MRQPVDRNSHAVPRARRLAFEDPDFMWRDEMRPVRLATEFAKADLVMRDWKIRSTIIFFGSARGPRVSPPEQAKMSEMPVGPGAQQTIKACDLPQGCYDVAEEFANRVALLGLASYQECGDGYRDYVVVTGGGPGIMEAANRGAAKAGVPTIGLNIDLVSEQEPNPYVTSELSFSFQYFAIRKMHFLLRARALAFFPGGFGTLDELFDVLCLIQTGKMRRIPILMFGGDYWRRIIDFDAMAEIGTIDPDDLTLLYWPADIDHGWSILQETHAIEDVSRHGLHDL